MVKAVRCSQTINQTISAHKEKTPPISRESFLTVETRGIDVPSKDGGCGGPVCIFRL